MASDKNLTKYVAHSILYQTLLITCNIDLPSYVYFWIWQGYDFHKWFYYYLTSDPNIS